jgi:hypothetical protein
VIIRTSHEVRLQLKKGKINRVVFNSFVEIGRLKGDVDDAVEGGLDIDQGWTASSFFRTSPLRLCEIRAARFALSQ